MAITSDHLPLLFEVRSHELPHVQTKKPFRFENMWVHNSQCEEVIQGSWKLKSRPRWVNLVNGIEKCRQELSKWNRSIFGNVSHNIKRTWRKLQQLMSAEVLDANAIDSCRKELIEILHREEIM